MRYCSPFPNHSTKMIAVLHEVIEAARNELTLKEEFTVLQKHNLDEVKYHRAIAKLEDGQFSKISMPPGLPSGFITSDSGLNTLFTLSINEQFISFEFLPGEDPEIVRSKR